MTEDQRKRRLRALHSMARRFFPAEILHDTLSEMAAEVCGVASLRDLVTPEQFNVIESRIRNRTPMPVTRKRVAPRGRPAREGVVRTATPAQWQRIKRLMEQLHGGDRATREQLVAGSRRFFRRVLGDQLAWPDDKANPEQLDELLQGVLTVHAAQKVINSATFELKRRGLWHAAPAGGQS